MNINCAVSRKSLTSISSTGLRARVRVLLSNGADGGLPNFNDHALVGANIAVSPRDEVFVADTLNWRI